MVDGRRLIFGFEGIWQGTAVLYDRRTRSLWMHLTGECFDGKLAGTTLTRLPTGRHTLWKDWLALHPDTTVLARDPRYVNPANDAGYFPREGSRAGGAGFPTTFVATIQDRDPRLALHALLYGIVVGGKARAYPYHRLASALLAEEVVEGVPVAVWFDRAARSAAAFDRRVGGVTLTFEVDAAGVFRDTPSKSRWTLDGVCVEGVREGQRLRPLHGLQAEWYGWYATYPTTTLWQQY